MNYILFIINKFGIICLLFCALIFTSIFSCQEKEYKEDLKNSKIFLSSIKNLTDVIVYDIYSPPVASRIYAYSCIAAYEAMRPGYNDKYLTLTTQLKGLKPIPTPTNKKIDFHLAAIHSFNVVGKNLILSKEKMDAFEAQMFESLGEKGCPKDVMNASLEFGEKVAKHILQWASKDMYNETRSYWKYTVANIDSLWKPTPPDYMEGIEPNWGSIRPMVLDSSNQYASKIPVSFSLIPSSEFYRQLKEVYDVGNSLNDEQREITRFWDCNPFVTYHYEHAMFASKKITPGGHWMGITSIASQKANNSFDETIEANTLVSIGLFDAFISCWDEKWRSLMVRPETLINENIDEDWLPLLQTPPFPEYTSGHSVASRAAAIVLTDIYGDDFDFVDTVELEYGLPSRNFDGFLQASEEAAISGLYGGIHYMMAIENGLDQGEQVGKHLLNRVNTRKRDEKNEKS